MAYTRNDLITQALGNLGIVRLTDASQTVTQTELVKNVARILGVLPSGQALSAEDSDIITPRVATAIADLNARAIVTINTANAIPGGMFDALSDIVANASKGAYEIWGDASTAMQAKATIAERKLYSFGGATIVDTNLNAVLAEIGSDDLVSIVDPNDIPNEWFGPVAAIVSDRIKGKFPLIGEDVKARVKMDADTATMTLRRITRGRPSYNRAIPEWV